MGLTEGNSIDSGYIAEEEETEHSSDHPARASPPFVLINQFLNKYNCRNLNKRFNSSSPSSFFIEISISRTWDDLRLMQMSGRGGGRRQQHADHLKDLKS